VTSNGPNVNIHQNVQDTEEAAYEQHTVCPQNTQTSTQCGNLMLLMDGTHREKGTYGRMMLKDYPYHTVHSITLSEKITLFVAQLVQHSISPCYNVVWAMVSRSALSSSKTSVFPSAVSSSPQKVRKLILVSNIN